MWECIKKALVLAVTLFCIAAITMSCSLKIPQDNRIYFSPRTQEGNGSMAESIAFAANAPFVPTTYELYHSERKYLDTTTHGYTKAAGGENFCGYNLQNLDFTSHGESLQHAAFDSSTQWPALLPEDFNPQAVMEQGKNPGLGIRWLHERGITGKGVGIAFISRSYLAVHKEYSSALKLYKLMGEPRNTGSIEGTEIVSMCAGKSVGIAPGTGVYYFVSTKSMSGIGQHESSYWVTEIIKYILQLNESLPAENKIRVIYVTSDWMPSFDGTHALAAAVEQAVQSGILVLYSSQEYMSDAGIEVSVGGRSTASPMKQDEYIYYPTAKPSWVKAYLAGLYALTCQVKPDIVPDEFLQALREIGRVQQTRGGRMVDPGEMIRYLINSH